MGSWASINSLSLPKGRRSCVLSSFTCLLPDIQDPLSQFTHFLPHCAGFFFFFLGLEKLHGLIVLFVLNSTKKHSFVMVSFEQCLIKWAAALSPPLGPHPSSPVPAQMALQPRWNYTGKPVLVRSNPAPVEISSQTGPLHRFGLTHLKGW